MRPEVHVSFRQCVSKMFSIGVCELIVDILVNLLTVW